jgi:Xaa-Pro dipeptidase
MDPPSPRVLEFTRDEFARRLAAVRQHMTELDVDVLVVDAIEHLAWLAGWHASGSRYHACLVPRVGEPVMVCRRLDEPAFWERSWLGEAVFFADAEDPVEAVAGAITRRGWAAARLGVELDSHYLTVETYRGLRAALPAAAFVDFAGIVRRLRLRKSPAEVAYIQQAATIADQAMHEAIAAAGEGRSEREAAAAAAAAFLRLGADSGRTGPITAGRRSGTLHGTLGDHRLEAGDLLHMELVPSVRGYSARLMRPTVIGPPPASLAAAALALVEIQDEQIAAMRPRAAARDIDRIARDGVLKAGLRDAYDNFTGYTLGYYGSPLMAPRSSDFTRAFLPTAEWSLEAGMVFHMYTGAQGMAFSETVLVGEHGPERLTRLERRLFVR